MKYGQLKHVPWLKEHNVRNIFLQKLCRKWGRETNSRSISFFFLKKEALNEIKASGLHFSFNQNIFYFNIFWFDNRPFDPDIDSILIFRKETSFSTTFVAHVSIIFFFILYCLDFSYYIILCFIVWLLFLGYWVICVLWLWCIEINISFQKQPCRAVLRKRCSENMQQTCRRTPMPKCDFNKVACKFIEIALWASVLSCQTVFLHDQKSQNKNFNTSEQEKAFGEIKSIFHHFKRTSNFQKLSKTWKVAFKCTLMQIWKSPYMFVCI